MKKFYLNLMLIVMMMSVGMNAWGAGYTRTLDENLEVPGYKVKTLYNFQTNTPDVLPTSGDLRYRDGNIWGLHNFGSGTRSATVNIEVKEGQLLVFQHYSDVISTINVGSLNSTLSTTTGYQCYDITSDATSITVTIARYGGVVAALLMDKDESAATASYTINYLFDGEVVKTVTDDEVTIGLTITADNSVWVDETKYIAVDGQIMSMELVGGENILNINLREAENWAYSVNIVGGEQTSVLVTGSVFEGESVTVPYPRYVNIDGILYSKDAINNEYRVKVTPTNDNYVLDLAYSVTDIANVVYHSEGENIEGATATAADKTNIAVRSSNAQIGYASNDINLANLPAGKYTATMVLYSNSSAGLTLKFLFGDLAFNAKVSGASNWVTIEQEFVLTTASDVKWLASGDAKNGLDFIYIQRTGDVPTSVPVTIGSTLYTTFCSEYPLDLAGMPKSVSAYYVTADGVAENAVTLTQIATTVPAGTGLILHAESAGTYDIPIVASAEALEGNLLVGVLAAETISAEEGYMKYVLAKSGDKAVFQYIGATPANMTKGKAYIKIEESTGGPGAAGDGETPEVNPAKMLNIYLPGEGDATGIKTVDAVETVADCAIYNLAGQRVGKDYKGIVIMNGKKYLLK